MRKSAERIYRERRFCGALQTEKKTYCQSAAMMSATEGYQ